MDVDLLKNMAVRLLKKNESIPYELLLDADPSMGAILKYLEASEIYVALLNDIIVAAFVLYRSDVNTMEIKNISVAYELQGKGIGKFLLNTAMQIAVDKGARTLTIGTSNASIGQLKLYQKNGFKITGTIYNFFIDNYPEPIFENEIQCKHLVMLAKQLNHSNLKFPVTGN